MEADAAADAASDGVIAQRTIAAAAFVPLKDTFMNRNTAAVISGNCEKGTEKLRNA